MGRTGRLLRRSGIVAAIIVAIVAFAAASASAEQLAFIGNRESNDVSIVNTATNQVVGSPIEAGEGPASIAITPDGRFAYVADAFGESVSVIETSTRKPVGEMIKVGATPFGLAITPDGSRVFVTDRGSDEVSVIETQTRQVVDEIELPPGSAPTGVAVSPDGKFAYVTEFGADAVEVIDTETMKALGDPIGVGDGPQGLEFTPDGKTAYVVDDLGDEVSAIDPETRKVTPIPLEGEEPRGIVVAPDGQRAFVVNLISDSVAVIDTATDKEVEEISVGSKPQEVAITANGKTVYVTETGPVLERVPQVQRIDVESGKVVGSPIAIPGEFPGGIAITPDQSPTAAFTVPNITAGVPAVFSGAASTDPDGTIGSYAWEFGDGKTGTGVSPVHTYAAPGTYNAKLTVVDEEGCGEEEVFTGRTAYCSGGKTSVIHPVTAKLPVPPPPPGPSNRFHFGRLVHNRRNGTVRLQVKLPAAGSVLLVGRKVHLVRRKIGAPGSMWLTIHPRVEVNKRLKKVHRIRAHVAVTFSPTGGTPRTKGHRLTLLRKARRHHHGHRHRS